MFKHLAAALLVCACSPLSLRGQSASIPVTLTLRPAAETRGDTVAVVLPDREGVSIRPPAAPTRRQPTLPTTERPIRSTGPGAPSLIDALLPFVVPGTLPQVTAGRIVVFVASPNN